MIKINKKGFTLIELLVVIAIIGILSTLAVVAYNNSRIKARDTKRVADIKQISKALEQYYSQNNSYPRLVTPGQSLVSPKGNSVLMGKVPNNPTPRTDGGCADRDYIYQANNNQTSYTLYTCIANEIESISSGDITYTPTGWGTGTPSGATWKCGDKTDETWDIEKNVYTTTALGGKCWLREPLRNFSNQEGTCLHGIDDRPCSAIDRETENITYPDGNEGLKDMGLLYSYQVISDNYNRICPTGWDIASDEDWNLLEKSYNRKCEQFRSEEEGCSPAGNNIAEQLTSLIGYRYYVDGKEPTFEGINSSMLAWSPGNTPNISRLIERETNPDSIFRKTQKPALKYNAAIYCVRNLE